MLRSVLVVVTLIGVAVGGGSLVSLVAWFLIPSSLTDETAPQQALFVAAVGLGTAALTACGAVLTGRDAHPAPPDVETVQERARNARYN